MNNRCKTFAMRKDKKYVFDFEKIIFDLTVS